MARKRRRGSSEVERPSWCEEELRRLLHDLLDRQFDGKYVRLVGAIADANRGPSDDGPVERRKLTAFLEGSSVKFSFAELEALSNFLARHNQRGLAALFDRPSIL